MNARADILKRLLRLRDLRLQTAERALLEARTEVERCEEALAACEATVARVVADQAALDAWFQAAPDPRHFDSALHRRAALTQRRAEAEAERCAAEGALTLAHEAHAAALVAMNRARARRDVAQTRVADHRRALTRREERAAEEDGDERAAARPWRGLSPQGATA